MAPLQVLNFDKDVVYLHQFAGTDNVSSVSPYCVKVEAFLRLHNLKFERRNTNVRGANGMLPFVELNGVQICDSEAIFKKLTEHFQLKNFADEHAEGLGFALERMIENHTLHLVRLDMGRAAGALIRALYGEKIPGFAQGAASSIGGWAFRRGLKKTAKTAIGAFSEQEYDDMLRYDLLQLQKVLGSHQFLMGDSPTRVDTVALAHIAYAYRILPTARTHLHEMIESKELSLLKEYLDRIVTRLFGDDFNEKR